MDRDRTRLVQREGDRSTLADREKVHRRVSVENRGDFTDKADARKDTNEARDLENSTRLYNNEIAHVRTGGVEGRNVAVLDKQEAADIRFRDDGKNEGQEMSEEEQRMDEDAQIKNGVLPGARLGGPERMQPLHKPQQLLQQNSLVRWERFLPQRQLRVLLVEDDDSTRHVVSALLRNCSYEVTSAANGLQAWELLENPASHFDLVLTEVVMQCLSGIGLLSKIMAHEGCKHIPVIMMSSHDSMGIVFKCLSKGAVDFLVKPVRKNELKNLWQHVWRRCHSSSGSGSGSGSQTQKITRRKSGEVSGNNTDSNDESDNASSGRNIMDGSDNGSGTQSSWTKRVVEVESREQRDDWDLVHYHIGPSMEVPRQSRLEKLHRDWVQCGVHATEADAKKEFDYTMGQDLEIAMPAPAAAELKYLEEYKEPLDSACAVEEQAPSTSSGEGEHMGEEGVDTGFGGSGESSTEAIDLIGAIALKDKHAKEQGGSKDSREKGNNHTPNSNDKRGPELISPSLLELTLKRPRPMGEVEGEGDDRRVLRHSGSSAFSRYNTNVNHTPALSSGTFQINVISMPSGYGGHSFIQGSDILSSNPTAMHLAMQTGKFAPVKGGCEMSTSHLSPRNGKQDISPPIVGKPGQDAFPGSMSIKEEPGSVSPVPQSGTPMPIPLPPPGILYDRVPAAYGSVHPVFYSQPGVSQWGKVSAHITERGEGVDHSGFHDHCHNQNRQSQMHHHSHHHSHHHHHHIQHHYHHHHQHKAQQRPSTPQQDEQTVTNDGTGAPRCGSSNMVNVAEGNNGQSGSSNGYGSNGNGNGSVNGSATGSNNASNGHNGHSNGQSAVALAAGGNGDSGTQNKNSGTGIGNAVITGNAGTGAVVGPDHNRSARREAALTKFRQKRKERCFEKKVRYQSRKRLAEQRPRVRGQFVRQSVYNSTAGEPE